MGGSTRLYQRARSPLIQGQSKRERPLWKTVMLASFASIGVVFVLWWLIAVVQGAPPLASVVVFLIDSPGILVRTVPGAVVGSVAGVIGARAWGSSRPWVAGAVLGTILAGAGLLFVM